MAAARIDVGTAIAQRAAQTAVRADARSAVLGRFEAADARRQFSLDQADEARADRATRTAASRAETRGATDRQADDRRNASDVRTSGQSTEASSMKDRPRTGTARSDAAGGASAGNRGPAGKPEPTAETATPDTGGELQTTDEAAGSESAAAGEARAATETAPGIASAPQPNAPAIPASASTRPSPGAPQDGADQAQAAEPSATKLDGKAPEVSGAASTGEAAPQGAGAAQTASAGAEASFSALLDTAEPSPAASTGTATKAAASTDAPADASASQPATAPMPLGAVSMTIALRSLQNASRFEIRLDPLELGRIDVTLDIDKESGTVSADLVVDRPATLALLQRDAGTLQQALAQAGLDASAGISLSLRDGGGGQDHGNGAPRHQAGAAPGAQPRAAADAIDPIPLRALRLSGLDIRI